MQLRFFLILLLFFFSYHNLFSQGTWTQKANAPSPARWAAAGFSIGNYGYITCGQNGSGIYLNDLWQYDPSANSWTQKSNFPGTARISFVAFAIGSKGYLGTGENSGTYYNDFWEYDPSANSWQQKANFPGTARWSAVGISIGNYGYLGLGRSNASTVYNDFWKYDPIANSWTSIANYPGSGRIECGGFTIGNFGYIGAGSNPCSTSYNDFWEYSPSANSWTAKAKIPGNSKQNPIGFSLCSFGYFGWGDHCGPPYDIDLYQYNSGNNSWAQMANLPASGRDNPIWFSINNKGYAGTGGNNPMLNDFWEYDPGFASANLIANGDFSMGNTGFITDYTYCNSPNCLYPLPDTGYAVGTNANYYHNSFSGIDHTSGSGNFLMVNGGQTAKRVWNQTVSVQPNSNYTFSGWVCSIYTSNFAQISFEVNGTSIGSVNAPASVNTWIPFSAIWNSGANTSAILVIRDLNNSWNGNDFGIDDLSFSGCSCSTPPQVLVSGNSTICKGQNVSLSASGGTTYSWSTGATSSSVIINPTASANYFVIGTDSCGSDTANVFVTVNSLPIVSITGNNSICSGSSSTLTASGGNFYSWSNGNTNISISVSPTTSTFYSVTATTSNGCSDSVNFMVSVATCSAPVSAFSSVDNNICEGKCVQFIDLSSGPPTSWQWNFPGGNPNSSSQYNPTVCYDSLGTYNVILVTSNSTSSDTLVQQNYVTVKDCFCPEIYLPNAFSPNSDNENDFLFVQGTKCVKTFHIAIYDRWGEKVFETTDFTKGWDGNYNGKKENTQVYSYYLEGVYLNGNNFSQKGNISLLR